MKTRMADDEDEELEARIRTLNIEKDEDLSEEDDWEQLEERLEEKEEEATRKEQMSEKRNALKGLVFIT